MITQSELIELVEYSQTLKVLYVEDGLEVREQTLKLLENFVSDITIGVDGQDGLDKFKEQKYDLILTDLNMPVMNGIDMIRNIRLVDEHIPIVVISAHNEKSFKEDAKKYNIVDYILKPVDLDTFINILFRIKNL